MLTALRSEKTGLTEEAHRIIKSIRQMEASLEDDKVITSYRSEDEDIKVTVPLIRCLQGLKERHNTMAKLHRERFEQVKSKHLAPGHKALQLMSAQSLYKPSNHIRRISNPRS